LTKLSFSPAADVLSAVRKIYLSERGQNMKTVILRTGEVIPEPTVATTMVTLRSLAVDDYLAFFEFVELCRNGNHKLWDVGVERKLKSLSLIQSDGRVHRDVRAVVLAAVQGDGVHLVLVSPVGE